MDFSMPSMDFLKPTPKEITVRLESIPAGANARTSMGPGCNTPCSVTVPATESFSVSFNLDKYQSQTVQVQTSQQSGETVTTPNPVFAELTAVVAPAKKPVKRPAKKPAAKSAAMTPAQADSAFPAPPLR
jgi:hypothetical protein